MSEGEDTVETYMLRDDLSRDDAAYLAEVLKRLEYFSATAVARQGLQNLGNFFRK